MPGTHNLYFGRLAIFGAYSHEAPQALPARIILQTLRSQEALEVQRFGCQAIRDLAGGPETAAKSRQVDQVRVGEVGSLNNRTMRSRGVIKTRRQVARKRNAQ